jgi:hypothetical protein
MTAESHDRRSSTNEPLRDAFDELVASLERREGDAVARVALRACAERARSSGIPPERFLVTLKRLLASRPDLMERLAAVALFRKRRNAYDEIVTWAIQAYFGVADG